MPLLRASQLSLNTSLGDFWGILLYRVYYKRIEVLYMKNRGSIIASYIERDYRIKKAYEKKKRVNCIMKPCEKCEYEKVCEDKENDT